MLIGCGSLSDLQHSLLCMEICNFKNHHCAICCKDRTKGLLLELKYHGVLIMNTQLLSLGILSLLTLNVRGPSYLDLTRSISWLLMPWLLRSPGHQQPWYWLYRICRSFSYWRNDFKCHINMDEWHKCMFMFPLKYLAHKGLTMAYSRVHWGVYIAFGSRSVRSEAHYWFGGYIKLPCFYIAQILIIFLPV